MLESETGLRDIDVFVFLISPALKIGHHSSVGIEKRTAA
jgi:hypothetical protein